MPYKYNDRWHKSVRKFMASASIGTDATSQYKNWLNHVGEALSFPNPQAVTLPQLRELERTFPGGESYKAVQFSVARAMLIYSGCKAAREWRFPFRVRPKVDGVFLSEVDVAAIRPYARARGTVTELLFSLGVDNGLRIIDMRRLTMENARELSVRKCSTILGKGRGGGKPGHLELSRVTERPLAAYLSLRREWVESTNMNPDKLLVVKYDSELRPMSADYVLDRIREVSEESGVYFRPHDLRRTYGHRLHDAGIPIETIARLLRHETINQSFRSYIGIDNDELRQAQDRLG